MKIKFDIDVTDLINDVFEGAADNWDPYEGVNVDFDMKEVIKNEIVNTTKREVLKTLKEPLQNEINERVIILLKDSYKKEVEKSVKDFIKNGTVKKDRYDNTMVSVDEWVQQHFQGLFSHKDRLYMYVEKQAAKITQEIKDRYDLLFASSLVAKMNDQGLLKDGVFKSIMKKQK